MLSDQSLQRYVKALYPIGALLLLVPLVDLTLRTFPPQFGTLQWRFATVGLLLGNLGTLLLGTGLIGLVAAMSGQRRVLRVLGIVALALGVVFAAVLVLFALDAIQIRRLANANFKRAILLSSAGAMFNGAFGSLVLFVLGRASLVASRVTRPVDRRPRSASPLVVSRPGAQEVGAGRPTAPDVAARPSATEPV